MNLNSILIGSEDPKRLAEFYTKLFGEPVWQDSDYSGWMIGAGGLSVGRHDQVHGANAEPGRMIWNIETTDVQGEFERLRDAGATVVREPYQMSDDAEEVQMTIATFSDPDGNYFQLVSPM